MAMRYILFSEATDECDWSLYLSASGRHYPLCGTLATWALVDTSDTDDTTYPEGFHCAHACDKHAPRILEIANGS